MSDETGCNGSGEPVAENTSSSEIVALDESNEHDPQFEPIVQLPEIEVSTNEENETELVKLRAKLFRFDTSDPEVGHQWKERGTGEVKLLQHNENFSCRVVMRRDKTLKICANHFIVPWMELQPSFGSDRAWLWTVAADFADETPKSECLAIKFANPTIANEWKTKFDEARNTVKTKCHLYNNNQQNSSTETVSDLEPSSDSEVECSNEEVKDKAKCDTVELTETISKLNVAEK